VPVRNTRRRYLLFKIHVQNYPLKRDIIKNIIGKTVNLYGVKGFSIINPKLIQYNSKTKKGILRCRLEGLNMMRSTISLITKIEESQCAIEVLRVSGTIKSLQP